MLRTLLATSLLFVSVPALAAGTDASAVAAPATMQWNVRDLAITRRVAPAFPAGSSLQSLAQPVACRATVRINGNGVPASVDVSGCPDAFAAETHAAVSQWRWQAWSSLAERRVTLSVKFGNPMAQRAMPMPEHAAAPAATQQLAGALPAERSPVAPVATPATMMPPAPAPTPVSWAPVAAAPVAAAPVATAPIATAPVAPVAAAVVPQRTVAPAPVIPASPYSAAATRSVIDGVRTTAAGVQERQVVCSATIVRNRRGIGRKVSMKACPASYQDAAYEALKEISKTEARRVGRDAPAKRIQPVRITFALGEV